MEFILASSNQHKVDELNLIFKETKVVVKPAREKLEVIEDGTSFQENAYKKAKAYFDVYQTPVLADDSGLVLPARADILGIHSARFAPQFENYEDKNLFLIEEIKELKAKEREAYFCCYFCFYLNEQEIYYFEGRVHGKIATEAKGSKGFGYDPIFLPTGQDGKSIAQLSEWKMSNSHRAKAASSAIAFFDKY